MPGDIEKAKREIRYAKSAAADRRWDLLEPRLQTIEAALQGVPDAEAAPVLAELKPLREKLAGGVREEKAGRIEREIKRSISAAADELSRGYAESPSLAKAVARLDSPEAREVLTAEAVARLQAEIAPLRAKSGGAPPPPAPATPAPAATPPPASKPPPTSTPAPQAVDNERAKAIENDVARTLRFAADELGRNPMQVGSGIARASARLDSDDARQHLPPEAMQRLRARVAELQAKYDAAVREDQVRVLEDFIGRFIRQGESDLGHNRRGAGDMLRKASERILQDDAKQLLSAESVARFRSEIARVQELLAAAGRKDALDRALPILQELEERVAKPIFDGSQPEWRILGDLDSLKARVRGALSDVPKDDAEAKAIETRVAAVDAIIAGATAKLGREQAHARVAQLWELERQAIAGWEEETAGTAAAPTYEMPKTATAVRRLTWFQNDGDVQRIGSEYKDDAGIQSLIADARKTRESAVAKLHAAFNALLAFMEKQPRPSSRFDLEKTPRLSGQAGGDFDGTPHKEANVARAKKLGDRWEAEIEADRKARQAKYDELSAAAAAAWPGILSKIKADDGFDPLEGGSKGRTVLVKGLRNRIRWDFSGAFDFAIWVNETPVAGNYDKAVLAAVEAACEKTGLPLDDHTDWDAVIVVGGPGKIKQRFNVVVRDRSNLEIGKIEEWRPVDCLTCTVIALRAGPVAAGPQG